jgi:tRNA-specific 2-thiouridylase
MSKVMIWLSWWVDSAVAAYLLQQQGHELIAGFMKNYADESNPHCQTREDRDMAIKVAQHLGITTFVIFDFRKAYDERIVQYIYDGYARGITPNPDVLCNSLIKFWLFLDEATKLGCSHVATGHYARVTAPQTSGNSYYGLYKWVDTNKDQSYFLSWLTQKQLAQSLFPLGNLTKPEVRELAQQINLPNADRKDSQGICFIGKVGMEDFLKKKIPAQPGEIRDTHGKVLWTHAGMHNYTIGQREGLWLAWGPRYVVNKDAKENVVIVGHADAEELYHTSLNATAWHWVGAPRPFPLVAQAKIRYRQADQEVTLTSTDGQQILATFTQPQRAITSWQIIAIYDGDELIASGSIQ